MSRYGLSAPVGILRQAMPDARALSGEVPHEDDWWVSTDDALEYARWLGRQVEDVDKAYQVWLVNPATAGKAIEWNRETKWGPDPWKIIDPWVENWRAYLADLEESWWARVNSWYKTKQAHAELIEFAERARKLGLPNVPEVQAVPKDPEDKLGGGAETASSLFTGIGIAGLGIAAVLLVKGMR